MYAFVQISGRQYKVTEGQMFETFVTGGKPGEKVEMTPIAYFNGTEMVVEKTSLQKAKVFCEVLAEKKGKKVYSFRKTHKTGFKKGVGHRDHLVVLKVEKIVAG